MNLKIAPLICIVLIYKIMYGQEKKVYTIHTIAFYNLENLFDPENDPLTYDDDRTPEGKDRWTYAIYQDKIKNMAKVISEIGREVTNSPPVLLGVAEIENRKVLEDIANHHHLLARDYGIIHFDSPDRRGIDVGLLYQKAIFRPQNMQKHELILYDNKTSKRIFTRDQLVVSGYLDGDLIHLIINHWPSRRGGEARSRYKRERAAMLNKKIMDSIFARDPYAKIISMGDFNDNPNSPSIKHILKAKDIKRDIELKGLYNPMINMAKKGIGSLAWRDQWSLFDQIIVSASLLTKDYTSYRYYKAGVFTTDYLLTAKGKYKGYPFRSFSNGSYTYGYSDHFPVYIYIIKEKKTN